MWLWRAFQELQTCRAVGMGVLGPIPLSAIWEYVDRYALPDWTIDAIFSLDAAWRSEEMARAPQPQIQPQELTRPAMRMIGNG